MLRKILKWSGIILIVLIAIVFIGIKLLSEKKPEAVPSEQGDALAEKVLDAINKPAFDSIHYLQWTFPGGRQYFWDKRANNAVIEWGTNKVVLDLDTQTGIAYEDSKEVPAESSDSKLNKAWSNWCNDSFWMIAPFKLFDPGTTRSIISSEEERGLLVEYASGGVTPGDSYLWILDEQNRPTGWKMWTSILPVKGAYTSWENWQNFDGAVLALTHRGSGLTLEMTDVKSGDSLSDFGYETDPFEGL